LTINIVVTQLLSPPHSVSLSSLYYTLVVPDVLYYDNLAQLSCKDESGGGTQPKSDCAQAFVDVLANSEVPRT